MRAVLVAAIFLVIQMHAALGFQASSTTKELGLKEAYQKVLVGLPKSGDRAVSSKLALKHLMPFPAPPAILTSVKTKDAKAAEVLFLISPSTTWPGSDCYVAYLFVDAQIVDSAMCWSYNRLPKCKLLLEDVNGDGSLDVVCRSGDNRSYLLECEITSRGFESIYPKTDGAHSIKISYVTDDKRMTLQSIVAPKAEHGYQLLDCTLSAKNISSKNVAIEPGNWYRVTIESASYSSLQKSETDKRTILKPGETISQGIWILVRGDAKDLNIQWKFVPKK
jgi:hypothetical protein